jgi:hypothetical protein
VQSRQATGPGDAAVYLADRPPDGPATPEELDELERLGRRFGELGLPRHADRVRAYYAARRVGRPPPPECWAPSLTRRWLENLRMPPYEHALPVRAFDAVCDVCTGFPGTFTGGVFPGGHRAGCMRCFRAWLVLHGPTT